MTCRIFTLLLSSIGFALSAMCQDWQSIQLVSNNVATVGLASGILWSDTGIVVGGPGLIFNTTNFFGSYTIDSTLPEGNYEDIVFLNRDTGYITCNEVRGGMLRTFDGGNTWSPMPTGIAQGQDIGSELVFANKDTAYSSEIPFIDMVQTYDGGTTWSESYVPSPNCNIFYRIKVLYDSIIYILCNSEADNFGRLWLIKSTDYGAHWQNSYMFWQFGNGDLEILDDTTFIVLATKYIYKSTDGGHSFDSVFTTNIELMMASGYRYFSFSSHDTGFVAVSGNVFKTHDAGSTWVQTNFKNNPSDYGAISFVCASSADKVILGTEGGYLYKTTTGGGIYTGEEQISPSANFALYPNPTTGKLNIAITNTAGGYNIAITNILGQTVYKNSQGKNEIDVSSLAPGVYLLKLQANGVYEVAKFVKQ